MQGKGKYLYASKKFYEEREDPKGFCLTCSDGNIIGPVVIVLVFDILDEVGYTPVHVVVFKVWIILDWFVVAQEVKAKSFRRTVSVKQNSGEQTLLVLIISTIVSCIPDPRHFPLSIGDSQSRKVIAKVDWETTFNM